MEKQKEAKKHCTKCGRKRRTFQKGRCAECLLPEMREGAKLITDLYDRMDLTRPVKR